MQQGLATATINVHLSALRRLAAEAADNALLDPEIAAGIAKLKGGSDTGNWLTKEQAETIFRLPDLSTLKGKRDRAILCSNRAHAGLDEGGHRYLAGCRRNHQRSRVSRHAQVSSQS